ncbi:ESX secretion-associated protein EspG [Pseudonocardia sp. CA-107938]|uniref:ESX secretion-associated protein EspG n=1 Tax=Pseudonocardia sp. CA-107938 TaxID=3240021 RepID=UPI003D9323E7
MIEWSAAKVVTTSEFEVCWELLRLGETPWQLDPPRSGLTDAERTAVITEAIDGLAARGLAFGRRLGPVLEEHLERLAWPRWSADVRYVAESLVSAVAAVRGERATVAVRHGREIALLDVPADDAVDVLLDLPGTGVPGPGRDVRLPAAVLDAARRAADPGSYRFVEELTDGGVSETDAALLWGMCRDVRMRGQFGATLGTGDGTRTRRAPYVIGFHATPQGRFRQVRRSERGVPTVTVGPATRADLRRELTDLLTS